VNVNTFRTAQQIPVLSHCSCIFLANHLKILTKIELRLNVLGEVEFLLLFLIRKIGAPWRAAGQKSAAGRQKISERPAVRCRRY
jgi:hypothetical protein